MLVKTSAQPSCCKPLCCVPDKTGADLEELYLLTQSLEPQGRLPSGGHHTSHLPPCCTQRRQLQPGNQFETSVWKEGLAMRSAILKRIAVSSCDHSSVLRKAHSHTCALTATPVHSLP